MNSSLELYIERLELLGFFSGYALVYLLINFFATWQPGKINTFFKTFQKLMPIAYALIGVLYLGMVIRNIYPDFTFKNINANVQHPFLKFWGISSILFFLPILRKKNYPSFLHSLVFFSILIIDLLRYSTASGDKNFIRNDMKVYTDSLLLTIAILLLITFISLLYGYFRKRNTIMHGE